MIELTLSELSKILGGDLRGVDATVFGSIETDSRLLEAGSLFFAKPGAVTDGHNFLADAKLAGAVAAVVERFQEKIDLPQIIVHDSVIALGHLAAEVLKRVRAESEIKVIGITGSNGKTSTKNMLGAILSKFGPTISPVESFNNEVGAPISILRVNKKTKFLVVELGADGLGSIKYLAEIAKPDIGVVLKVGMAHAGEFGGIEVTARIKAELPQALSNNDLFIFNSDDSEVVKMLQTTVAKPRSFGTNLQADYRFDDVNLGIDGTSAVVHFPGNKSSKVSLRILGEHQLMNATAALAVANELGLSMDVAVAALEELPMAERWRMQLTNRSDGVSVINDAYNASPESMKAALQTLAQLGKSGRRTIAVLGEMAELGEFSRGAHDELGRLVVRYNISKLVVVGSAAKLIHMGAMQEGSWDGESIFFDSTSDALEHIREMLVAGDIVLVKSSKSANLRYLGDDLMEVSV